MSAECKPAHCTANRETNTSEQVVVPNKKFRTLERHPFDDKTLRVSLISLPFSVLLSDYS
jgi:hypothetical protein